VSTNETTPPRFITTAKPCAFWRRCYGAVPLLDAPLSLVLPLATIEAALKKHRAGG
jgi:hypothetical protein